ncbi:hypothetical protein S40293_07359 [Stachybotrys chartarum IBT 40293]|nr:hypothetical protein S40293_07359 [Stachybotrys chartarum IBT 40293]
MIRQHHATRSFASYAPQTDTERALQDAVKELELQCKERIDLLEALRVSRQDNGNSSSRVKLSKLPESNGMPASKNAIGQGTIPAVTYSELSRPSLPHRPSLPTRTSSEGAVVSATASGPAVPSVGEASSSSLAPSLPPRPSTATRSRSPEKPHTMRTTLRSGKSQDKQSKVSRRLARPAGEGPSKAATLAWGASGFREQHTPTQSVTDGQDTPGSKSKSQDTSSRKVLSQLQWDRHSRRLLPQRDLEHTAGSGQLPGHRYSDEYASGKPSSLSVSAASSALNSSSQQDFSSTELAVGRTDRSPAFSSNPQLVSSSISPKRNSHNDGSVSNDSGQTSERKKTSADFAKRKPVRRRSGGDSEHKQPSTRGANPPRPREQRRQQQRSTSTSSEEAILEETPISRTRNRKDAKPQMTKSKEEQTDDSGEEPNGRTESFEAAWKRKKAAIMKDLPPGVDEGAAKQILNDIIVQGDEVRWNDIAGLDIAKNALRETVVYPFLRPDLFMGLREPARGMLLFGPPGTGKTMLARAVATESKSTFFSISASSLTSKYLGESEKLVRALFGLARTLAPSIIFVDEIDSLLSQRSSSGEHEATRRIKTEFLIQWSDLQRAAAGRETTERDKERGDANRVLVLAATNMPWAIDEAARRRFVRRQYIPLPEPTTRETQLRTLLGQQKHGLSNDDVKKLVELTDGMLINKHILMVWTLTLPYTGFSGSDITALAKDAAMGPLRSLGEALLHMTMDDIRPITMIDFEASLLNIRPSVSKSGLKEYEDWAKEFGERGG